MYQSSAIILKPFVAPTVTGVIKQMHCTTGLTFMFEDTMGDQHIPLHSLALRIGGQISMTYILHWNIMQDMKKNVSYLEWLKFVPCVSQHSGILSVLISTS